MNDTSAAITRPEQLEALKHRYGDDAKFVSKDGFPFNTFDLIWQLNGLGKKGKQIDTTWMLDMNFGESLTIDIRLVLANMAHHLSSLTTHSANNSLKNSRLSDLTIREVQNFWRSGSISSKKKMRAFFLHLYRYSPEKYGELYLWAKSIKNKQPRRYIYDPCKGALSDVENNELEIKLNREIRLFIENGFPNPRPSRIHMVGRLTSFGRLIALRLLQTLVRRPSNLIQLKWSDLVPVGDTYSDSKLPFEYTFSDEKELQVRMWKSKQCNEFRHAVEREPLLLNASVTKEVLLYRMEYQRRLNLRLASLNIHLTDTELSEVMKRCPVFFSMQLFSANFSNKGELFSALGRNSHAFHKTAESLNKNISDATAQLHIVSDRVAKGEIRVTNNRIRHTVGTNAARVGMPLTHIARLLGNTPSAAKVYLDLSNEQRASIDDEFSGNTFLIKAFSTNITELLSNPEYTIEDEFGREIGQAKSHHGCNKCAETRPIGCYGCDNFKALVTGDHNGILDLAYTKRELRIALGETPESLQRLTKQIRYIKATIVVCNAAIARERTLNDQ